MDWVLARPSQRDGARMISRFVNDDPGYIAWLAAHSSGYVLNTFPHVTASYLVLHRARCRTVNRPLSDDRHWTHQYGKTCSDDRAELAEWARRETGKSLHPCGSCLSAETPAAEGSVPAGPPIARPHGPRAPRPSHRAVIARLGDTTAVSGSRAVQNKVDHGFAQLGALATAIAPPREDRGEALVPAFRSPLSRRGARGRPVRIAMTQIVPTRRGAPSARG